jgi:hypothetical protein
MIEKSVTLSHPVDSELLVRLRFYLPYLCDSIVSLEIVSGASPEIRYTCAEESSCALIEAMARALLGGPEQAEHLNPHHARAVFDNRTAPCACSHDILPELLSGDHLIAFGPGQYGMGNLFLKTFKYFERECARMTLKQNPQEFVYPNLIPRDLMEHSDYANDQGRGYTWFSPSAPGGPIEPGDPAETPEHLGKPAVCLHCYPHFKQRTIDEPVTITTQGRCYRYEGTDQFSPDRLWEFIMRETVYMGSPVFVRDSLKEIETLTTGWMQSLGLRAWVQAADDPLQASGASFAASENIPVKWELRIALPASGTSLAAASFNYHADHYSQPFEISEGGQPAATGCAGFGIERLTWGFLAQNGLDTAKWPEAIRQEL